VLQALGAHYVVPGLLSQGMVQSFGMALETRQRADYGSLSGFTRDQAAAILEKARRFVDRAGLLLSAEGPKAPEDLTGGGTR